MKLIERFLHYKAASVNESEPLETVVPDELIKHYPEPSEKLQAILQKVPATGKVLYQHIMQNGISKESKYWAMDMMENGFETHGIIQLAGEDLNMNPFAYSDLFSTIVKELDIEEGKEVVYRAYAVSIADEVLQGERTARDGFEILSRAAIDTDYNEVFRDFYIWLDNADEVAFMTVKGSGLRMDNVEEWLHQYCEKFVKANYKYSSVISNLKG